MNRAFWFGLLCPAWAAWCIRTGRWPRFIQEGKA